MLGTFLQMQLSNQHFPHQISHHKIMIYYIPIWCKFLMRKNTDEIEILMVCQYFPYQILLLAITTWGTNHSFINILLIKDKNFGNSLFKTFLDILKQILRNNEAETEHKNNSM